MSKQTENQNKQNQQQQQRVKTRRKAKQVVVETLDGEFFIVSSLSTRKDTQIFSIDPVTGIIHYSGIQGIDLFGTYTQAVKTFFANKKIKKFTTACGIIGQATFGSNSYLLIVTKADPTIELFCGHVIYTINSTTWIKIPLQYERPMTNKEIKNVELMQNYMVDSLHFYSETLDVTRPFPSRYSVDNYHPDFCWNKFLRKPFEDAGLSSWCIVMIQGLAIGRLLQKEGLFNLYLITRKSVLNPGTRYYSRGLNELGEAGNEMECELLAWTYDNENLVEFYSHIFRRGTVPVWWGTSLNSKVSHPEIVVSPEPLRGSEKYYQRLTNRFGNHNITCFNMLKCVPNNKETELTECYQHSHRYVKTKMDIDLKIINFDWHSNIKSLGKEAAIAGLWVSAQAPVSAHNLTSGHINLINDKTNKKFLKENIQDILSCPNGFIGKVSFISKQEGVMRYNCADSLDRTNVATFFIMQQILAEFCLRLNIGLTEKLRKNEYWQFFSYSLSELNKSIKVRLWEALAEFFVANGDVCSIAYTNSPAMHTALIREYSPNLSNAPNNTMIVLKRRYENVQHDHVRQLTFQLFLGLDFENFFPSFLKNNYEHVSSLPSWCPSKMPYYLIKSKDYFEKYSPEKLLNDSSIIWLSPKTQPFTELFIFLHKPCYLTELSLTIKNSIENAYPPAFIDVFIGNYMDNVRIIFHHLPIPICSDGTKLFFQLSSSENQNLLYDFEGTSFDSELLSRVILITFHCSSIKQTQNQIQIQNTNQNENQNSKSKKEQKKIHQIKTNSDPDFYTTMSLGKIDVYGVVPRSIPDFFSRIKYSGNIPNDGRNNRLTLFESCSRSLFDQGKKDSGKNMLEVQRGKIDFELTTDSPTFTIVSHNDFGNESDQNSKNLNQSTKFNPNLDFMRLSYNVLTHYIDGVKFLDINSNLGLNLKSSSNLTKTVSNSTNSNLDLIENVDDSLYENNQNENNQNENNQNENQHENQNENQNEKKISESKKKSKGKSKIKNFDKQTLRLSLSRKSLNNISDNSIEGTSPNSKEYQLHVKHLLKEAKQKNRSFTFLDTLQLELTRIQLSISASDRDTILLNFGCRINDFNPHRFIFPRDEKMFQAMMKSKKLRTNTCSNPNCKLKLKNNKHQCYYCLKYFCSKCMSLTKMRITEYMWNKPLPVCQNCSVFLTQQEFAIKKIQELEDRKNFQVFNSNFIQTHELLSFMEKVDFLKKRRWKRNNRQENIAKFPEAGILRSVLTDPRSSSIESILFPSRSIQKYFWFSQENVQEVEVMIALNFQTKIQSLSIFVDKFGYTIKDAPLITILTGLSFSEIEQKGIWDLRKIKQEIPKKKSIPNQNISNQNNQNQKENIQKENIQNQNIQKENLIIHHKPKHLIIQPNSTITYKFDKMINCKIISLIFQLPNLKISKSKSKNSKKKNKKGSERIHIGRIFVNGEYEIMETKDSILTLSSLSQYTQIKEMKFEPLKIVVYQYRPTIRILDIVIENSTKVNGFSFFVLHGEEGYSSQIRKLMITAIIVDENSDIVTQTMIGSFVIPRTEKRSTLNYYFENPIEANRFAVEFLSNYGGKEYCPGKITFF
ncbi:phosphoinositide phosphatase sac9-related [Anaeramoeba ignava]|uniref:Phosphoinositide phosphatase sac9-related n=1 Tax=Anaeramoeba ignava TaxID=1746090 RepID=A0A9Q0LPS1_ANAIG|nr:phosphoinositide phosphatase sac9-related [Anaeramoeba ignava]